MTLTHVPLPPRQPSKAEAPLLLLLHGVGSNERDLIQLAPYLDARFFVISARAPITLAAGMYAWFEVQLDPYMPIINPAQAETSRTLLSQFIDDAVSEYHVDRARVSLMGFSQGAIMSLSVGLTEPEKVAGVVAMSGRILPEVTPRIAPPERLAGLPIFVAHGTEDQVLPIHHGRAARELLQRLPVALTYREYPMGHTISDQSLADSAAWLTERLDEPPRAQRDRR
jgi:phospholipase/carboxylesterase